MQSYSTSTNTSGDQCIADNTVSTCSNLNVGQGTTSYVESDSALDREFSEDAEHIQKPFTHETAAKLNRLRNQEHSLIYRLPPELLAEILLLAVDWRLWSVEQLRPLASVSTSWRDTILSCTRFWSVMDALASEKARRTAMKRNPEGPVDLWCKGRPSASALESFINDVKTIKQTRLRSVVCDYREEMSEFMKWLQDQNSAFIDVLITNDCTSSVPVHLELSSEGPALRHIDIRAVILPWQSPRLTNLRTIHLAYLRFSAPQVNHLYTILSSSPELERLSLVSVGAADGESPGSLPATARLIELPVLKTLVFEVAGTIAQEVIPLIRASECHTVIADGGVVLEPREPIMKLIAKPITLSDTLMLRMEDRNGTFIHIFSGPSLSDSRVYWVRDRPGVNVKIAIPSARVLSMFWNWLDSTLLSYGGTIPITSLDVEWTEQDFPFPFSLLEHCPVLTRLRFSDDFGTILHPLIQFLGANGTPNLEYFRFFAKTIPNLEDCVSDTKEMLERRYPPSTDEVDADEAKALPVFRLPQALVNALQQRGVSTSLNFGKQINGPTMFGRLLGL
ncbi:hypothetical protein FRC04_012138 [Tulasnella sp. 424]|nr:hypothetical protein FRC04_012138 [Tulasnella sp. 424]